LIFLIPQDTTGYIQHHYKRSEKDIKRAIERATKKLKTIDDMFQERLSDLGGTPMKERKLRRFKHSSRD
jgi:hypothetical protein